MPSKLLLHRHACREMVLTLAPRAGAKKKTPTRSPPINLITIINLILAKAVAMRVMINATGCPAPVLDRNRMNTHKHLSQLIASAIDHDIPTPV